MGNASFGASRARSVEKLTVEAGGPAAGLGSGLFRLLNGAQVIDYPRDAAHYVIGQPVDPRRQAIRHTPRGAGWRFHPSAVPPGRSRTP